MSVAAAAVTSYDTATLRLGDAELACLYVVVDGRSSAVIDFLASSDGCCTTADLDWQLVRRPRAAHVGIELRHTCGRSDADKSIRLVLDVDRDALALERLAATEALVIGTRAFGSFANVVAAFGVDGAAVKAAARAARAGLHHELAVAN